MITSFFWFRGFCVPLFFMALLYQEKKKIGRYKMTLKDVRNNIETAIYGVNALFHI